MNAGGGHGRSIASRWRLILVSALLGLILGFAWGIADRPLYLATATVAVESDSQGSDVARLERFAQRGMSEEVATVAAGLLGGDVAGADLLSDVAITPAPQGGAVVITATSESPDYTAAAADGVAEALVEVEGDPLALGASAAIPAEPFENRSATRTAALGLAVGALVGLLLAALLTFAGRRGTASGERRAVRGDREPAGVDEDPAAAHLADRLGVPRLDPLDPDGASPTVHGEVPVSVGAAALAPLRSVAAAIGLDHEEGPTSIAISALGEGHDAAGIGAGLAVAAANAGGRILLVEADLANPVLAGRYGLAPEPGLQDHLEGNASPREVLRSIQVETAFGGEVSLACVPAGSGAPRAGAGQGNLFAGLVGRLARVYDHVIYIAPPAGEGVATDTIASLVDGVLLLADEEGDADEQYRAALELSADRLLGVAPIRRVNGSF